MIQDLSATPQTWPTPTRFRPSSLSETEGTEKKIQMTGANDRDREYTLDREDKSEIP